MLTNISFNFRYEFTFESIHVNFTSLSFLYKDLILSKLQPLL